MEYYPRKIEQALGRWLERKEAMAIKGPRQAGKTTLMLHLKERTGAKYVTFEDPDLKDAMEKDAKGFAERFLGGGRTILLLDEVQYVKDAGKRLKLIYDLFGDRVKIIATGSGSFDIKAEIGKSMVGRIVYFTLLPLRFGEFLLWKAGDLHKTFSGYSDMLKSFLLGGGKMDVAPVFEKEFLRLLEEYVIFGGYPAVVKEADSEIKKELLKNLTTTYLEKDVFFFLGVRHLEKFRDFVRYMSFNNGAMTNHSNISQNLRMDYSTIESYMGILASTYVILEVPPFFRSLTTELKKARKGYFFDTGLRNSLIGNYLPLGSRSDGGALLENFVVNELHSAFGDARVNYWRTAGRAEVDFVLQLGDRIVPVEVKSNEAKISRGMMSFIDCYRPERAIVFTFGKFGVEKVNGTRVAFLPHYYL